MEYFYRVENTQTKQGVWYDYNGNFTGLIHTKFSFCKNSDLQMPFCEETAGYLSVTNDINDLFNWFPKNDIVLLQKHGYRVSKYKSSDVKHNGAHYLINKNTASFIGYVEIDL